MNIKGKVWTGPNLSDTQNYLNRIGDKKSSSWLVDWSAGWPLRAEKIAMIGLKRSSPTKSQIFPYHARNQWKISKGLQLKCKTVNRWMVLQRFLHLSIFKYFVYIFWITFPLSLIIQFFPKNNRDTEGCSEMVLQFLGRFLLSGDNPWEFDTKNVWYQKKLWD